MSIKSRCKLSLETGNREKREDWYMPQLLVHVLALKPMYSFGEY